MAFFNDTSMSSWYLQKNSIWIDKSLDSLQVLWYENLDFETVYRLSS